MSKKKFIATIIIIAFVISLSVGMLTVTVTMANPYPTFYPLTPVKDPAIIMIQNPADGTVCLCNQIQVNFTVTQPASWFQNGLNVGSINDIYCQIDEGTNGTFNVLAINPLPVIHNTQPFSINLNVTEGQHTLTIIVDAKTIYDVFHNANSSLHSFVSVDSTQTVNFTVANEIETTPPATLFPNPTYLISPSPSPTQQPTPEPNPTPNSTQENLTSILIIAALVVVIGAVIVTLFYFKKRKAN